MTSVLPPEILAHVFFFCLPGDRFPVPNAADAPLLLGRVCSQWKTVAEGTPALWTALHINYRDSGEDVPGAASWLSRSGSLPLSLSLAMDFAEQPQQAILDLLCSLSARWQHVALDFRHLFCPQMYHLDVATDNIRNLRSFEFHARDISNANIAPITALLANAPSLRHITWVDDLADTQTLLALPLSSLTRLSLAIEHGALDYLQLLSHCPNLEHIRITRPHICDSTPDAPVPLHKLTSLNIPHDLMSVLDHLLLPALCQVRIFTEGDKHHHHLPHLHNGTQSYPNLPLSAASPTSHPSTPFTLDPLLTLIDRSSCSITSLSINTPGAPTLSEDALLLLLRKTSPSLQRLHLENLVLGDLVLGKLTRRKRRKHEEEEEELCPNLLDLDLDVRILSSPGVLRDMVASRLVCPSREHDQDQEHQTPLRKLRLVDGHRDLDALHDLASDLLARGLPALKIHVIPRPTPKLHQRHYFYRRKLCASR